MNLHQLIWLTRLQTTILVCGRGWAIGEFHRVKLIKLAHHLVRRWKITTHTWWTMHTVLRWMTRRCTPNWIVSRYDRQIHRIKIQPTVNAVNMIRRLRLFRQRPAPHIIRIYRRREMRAATEDTRWSAWLICRHRCPFGRVPIVDRMDDDHRDWRPLTKAPAFRPTMCERWTINIRLVGCSLIGVWLVSSGPAVPFSHQQKTFLFLMKKSLLKCDKIF